MADIQDELKEAVNAGDVDKVKTLIEEGADVNWQDDRLGTTVLMFCANLGSAELGKIIPMMIQAGLDPNMQNLEGETALHMSAKGGNLGAAKLMIEAGADVNIVDSTGRTVCFYAAQNGLAELIRLLLTDFDIDEHLCQLRIEPHLSAGLVCTTHKGHIVLPVLRCH